MWLGNFKKWIWGNGPVHIYNDQSVTDTTSKAKKFEMDNIFKKAHEPDDFEDVLALLQNEDKSDESICGSKHGWSMINRDSDSKAGASISLRNYIAPI